MGKPWGNGGVAYSLLCMLAWVDSCNCLVAYLNEMMCNQCMHLRASAGGALTDKFLDGKAPPESRHAKFPSE
jgi:hypothetical protein